MLTTASGPLAVLQAQLETEAAAIAQDHAADLVTVFVYDEVATRFYLPAAFGLRDRRSFDDPRLRPRLARVAGRVALERQPIIADQVPGHPLMDGPFARREGVLSAAGYPLVDRSSHVVGVCFVSYRAAHTFQHAQLLALEQAAQRLANVIAEANPWPHLRQDEGPFLPTEDATLNTIVELAFDLMPLAVGIWRLERNSQFTLIAAYGLTSAYRENARARPPRLGDGSWFDQIVAGPLIHLENVQNDARFHWHDEAAANRWVSALGLPVYAHGRVCAVVEGFSWKALSPLDTARLRRLAEVVRLPLENAQRETEVRIQAEVVQEISKTSSPRRALAAILEGAKQLTGASNGGIQLAERGGPRLALAMSESDGAALHCPCPAPDRPVSPESGTDCTNGTSRLDVTIHVGQEEIGTLYVCGAPGASFTDHEHCLLQTLAHQAGAALGIWWPLFRAIQDIERQSALLLDQEQTFREVLDQLRGAGDPPFDFAALNIIDPGEEVIEAVCGVGRAEDWQGRAKHYLEPLDRLRDIQADIALADPPRIEIITRKDPLGRFDEWIFETCKHHFFTRAFVPLLLARHADGTLLTERALEEWLRDWRADTAAVDTTAGGRRTALKLTFPRQLGANEVRAEIIGTIEAGYENCETAYISPQRAVALAKAAARQAPRVWRTLLQSVFQTIVDHAVRLLGARYASLHFELAAEQGPADQLKYVYQVFSGPVHEDYPRKHPPRANGKGWQAICEGRTLKIPDPDCGDPPDQLLRDNPAVYAEGITAMAAIPLRVGGGCVQPLDPNHKPTAGSSLGVMYVGFVNGPDGEVHGFTPSEIELLELFSSAAVDAIQHTTAFTRTRDEARLLTNLQSVAESLVSVPEDPDLLKRIAWNVLNILGADVVNIYPYDADKGAFPVLQALAGRLVFEGVMHSAVGAADTPALILKQNPVDPIYASTAEAREDLNPKRPDHRRPSFVVRESIKSTAAVPLVAGRKTTAQETVGILFVNYRRRRPFPDEQKRVIETLASAAAVAIKNGRLLQVFRDTDAEIIAARDINEVLKQIVERAVGYTHAATGTLRLVDPLRARVESRCHVGTRPDEALNEHPARRDIEKEVMDAGARWAKQPLGPCPGALVSDYAADKRTQGRAEGISGSELCVPLIQRDCCVGVLRVTHPQKAAFPAWQQPVLLGLANRAILALLTHDAQARRKTNEKLTTLGALYGTLLHRLKSELVLDIPFWGQEGVQAAMRGDLIKAHAHFAKMTELADSFGQKVDRLHDWKSRAERLVDVRDAARQGYAKAEGHLKAAIAANLTTPKRMPPVLADPELLAEVFAILIKNASEAMPAGGCVQVTVEQRGSWAVTSVTDTGSGIDPVDREDLFTPIHSRKPGGLGIGLWLAHSYLELLGGKIDVDTEVGRGTTFLVGIPTVHTSELSGGLS